jgi:transcriptional regulator with XRE-family HTH domain
MPARIGNPARRRRHFIKEWREFRDLSQEQLAELISQATGKDTTKTSISRIENGEQGYTQDSLEAIADALGTHVATLLSRPPSQADRYIEPEKRRKRA